MLILWTFWIEEVPWKWKHPHFVWLYNMLCCVLGRCTDSSVYSECTWTKTQTSDRSWSSGKLVFILFRYLTWGATLNDLWKTCSKNVIQLYVDCISFVLLIDKIPRIISLSIYIVHVCICIIWIYFKDTYNFDISLCM